MTCEYLSWVFPKFHLALPSKIFEFNFHYFMSDWVTSKLLTHLLKALMFFRKIKQQYCLGRCGMVYIQSVVKELHSQGVLFQGSHQANKLKEGRDENVSKMGVDSVDSRPVKNTTQKKSHSRKNLERVWCPIKSEVEFITPYSHRQQHQTKNGSHPKPKSCYIYTGPHQLRSYCCWFSMKVL